MFGVIVALACHLSIRYSANSAAFERIQKLSTDLVNEKNLNVRRARRLWYMEKPKAINIEAVAAAFHVIGIAPSAAAALLKTENGPQHIESGSLDKTDFFVNNFPIEQRSALEGSRTLTRQLWTWITTTDQGRRALHAFLMAAAHDYTAMGPGQQGEWTRNMETNELRYQSLIKFEAEGVVSLIQPTPTPDYGVLVSQKGKAAGTGKRSHIVRKRGKI